MFFFRPTNAYRLQGVFDEVCYLRWLSYFLNIPHEGCFSDDLTPGIAALWYPAGLLIKFIQSFYLENKMEFWLPISITVISLLYFALSVFLSDAILNLKNKKKPGLTLLIFLNIPILYYMGQNPHLTHLGELFLALLCVYCILKKWLGPSIVLAGLLTIVRLNDAPIFFLVIAAHIDFKKERSKLFIGLLSALFLALLYKIYQVSWATGYNSSSLRQILLLVEWSNVRRTFLAEDWGLLWVNLLWLGTIWFGFSYFKDLSNIAKACLAWMVLECILCVLWRGNGRYFGHRYLIGSYAGMLVVLSELFEQVQLRKILFWLAGIGGGWILFLSWAYNTKVWPWPMIDNHEVVSFPFKYAFQMVSQKEFYTIFFDSALGTALVSWGIRLGWLKESWGVYGLQGGAYLLHSVLVVFHILLLFFTARPFLSWLGQVFQILQLKVGCVRLQVNRCLRDQNG